MGRTDMEFWGGLSLGFLLGVLVASLALLLSILARTP